MLGFMRWSIPSAGIAGFPAEYGDHKTAPASWQGELAAVDIEGEISYSVTRSNWLSPKTSTFRSNRQRGLENY